MISQTLLRAREFEEEAEKRMKEEDRPMFHFAARTGWINDPNGFSIYNGLYHLFYQYYPYAKQWGPMHWGHAVSKDLLHWEHLPAALAPDTLADRDGCFSGSAVTLDDGRHLLMYTGVVRIPQPGKEIFTQTQCVAAGDGKDYSKYFGNPVLTNAELPPDSSVFDFRDPKVFREEDGGYGCVVGNADDKNHGRIMYFRSKDGFRWKYVGILTENDGNYGRMWECPDFFGLDGKSVLLVNPQDMERRGEYYNGNNSMGMIGTFDKEACRFIKESDQALDFGIDFYATQTLESEDGRRIMIGWMQNWDTIKYTRTDIPWLGQMTIPRELSIRDGRICQRPIREFDSLRNGKTEYRNLHLSDRTKLKGISGRMIDMEIEIRPEEAGSLKKFEIRMAQNAEYHSSLVYRPDEQTLEFDRSCSGTRSAVVTSRRFDIISPKETLKLRLIFDRYSVEAFINDGTQTMSCNIITDISADEIEFVPDGNAVIDIEKYDLCMD